jgi:hypothetical protein
MPTEEEWADICELVMSDPVYRYCRVPLALAIKAGEKLHDTLTPRMKAMEVTADVIDHKQAPAMTPEEIRLLNAALDEDDDF